MWILSCSTGNQFKHSFPGFTHSLLGAEDCVRPIQQHTLLIQCVVLPNDGHRWGRRCNGGLRMIVKAATFIRSEREEGREGGRQRDRQRDRQTETETETERQKQRKRQRERQTDRQTERERMKWTNIMNLIFFVLTFHCIEFSCIYCNIHARRKCRWFKKKTFSVMNTVVVLKVYIYQRLTGYTYRKKSSRPLLLHSDHLWGLLLSKKLGAMR